MKKLKIPLPTLDHQQILVKNYQAKLHLSNQQIQQAKQKESDIETYLYKELGIELTEEEEQESDVILKFVRFKNTEKWNFNSLLNANINFLHSSSFDMKKLSSIVSVNPTTFYKNLDDNLNISFVPMKYIDEEKGKIINQDIMQVKESRGYTKFKEGDLLWSRITPCMQNGKSAIAKNLINGYGCGSTEYHILRNYRKDFNLDYLYFILRTKKVLTIAKQYFTGSAGQQRVPKEFLKNLQIPLPPLQTQTKIANHIKKIKTEIQELKHQSEQNKKLALQEFESEIFNE